MADVVKDVPYPDIDVAQVRRYVQGRADSSSVRAVATAIGIGHTSLEKFLDGSSPFAKNRYPDREIVSPRTRDSPDPGTDAGPRRPASAGGAAAPRGHARPPGRTSVRATW
jgi:hypothetical protein